MKILAQQNEREELLRTRPMEVGELAYLEHPDIKVGEIIVAPVSSCLKSLDSCSTAMSMLRSNAVPIPVYKRSHRPAVNLRAWCRGLSKQAISDHWRHNPTHGLGYLAVKESARLNVF